MNVRNSFYFKLENKDVHKDNKSMGFNFSLPVENWNNSCTHSECTLHQLSPYIGKLKSSIAHELVNKFSKKNDLVVDPFSGSGTIPLEAAISGRKIYAADISPYSKILTKAKLSAPDFLEDAIKKAENLMSFAESQSEPDIKNVPDWVRNFFHPQTLKEALKFASIAREEGNEFWMACFLGILHHERPGFLSNPASHLVPYLRNRKYPRDEFPHMYLYRELRTRLLAKIHRIYKRFNGLPTNISWFYKNIGIESLEFPKTFDCLITSPPYMNALDYVRDNRLRLWFITNGEDHQADNPVIKKKKAFREAIHILGKKVNIHLKKGGFCILIVGERLVGSKNEELSKIICQIMAEDAPNLTLLSTIKDNIPDIRRARRNCMKTKTEHILVYRKV